MPENKIAIPKKAKFYLLEISQPPDTLVTLEYKNGKVIVKGKNFNKAAKIFFDYLKQFIETFLEERIKEMLKEEINVRKR